MIRDRLSPHIKPAKNVLSAFFARRLRDVADRFDPAFQSVKLDVVSCIDSCPVCPNGALTLVPLPGHEQLAEDIRTKITKGSISEQFKPTPVDIAVPKFGAHANDEPFLQLSKQHIGGHDCMVLTSGPGTYKMVMQLLIVLWYLVGRGAKRITVVSGYCPWSRSDKDEGTLILAIAPLIIYLIGAICGEKLSKIISADLHASQLALSTMPGKVTELQMMRRVIKYLLEDAIKTGKRITFAAPDDSAEKRFKKIIAEVCKELGIPMPLVVVYKRRSDSTNSAVTYVIGDTDSIKGSIVITFDDEAATVGSNLQLGRTMVEEYGALEVWAAVIHGVLCGPAVERLSDPKRRVRRLYATDTIPMDREELQPLIADGTIRVINWMDDVAWAIYMHHWDQNIRGVR
jgi:ribose-phosphate pyrophosphokinase